MVAYSFNSRFEVAIREGWKTQTIRAGRKRHARCHRRDTCASPWQAISIDLAKA